MLCATCLRRAGRSNRLTANGVFMEKVHHVLSLSGGKDSSALVYPLREAGSDSDGVRRLLEEVGFSSYYDWRTRSGCYFCFFQRRIEWVGLLEKHPDLFELAKQYEKFDAEGDQRYTWNQRE